MMGFLRRTFSLRSRRRFRPPEEPEGGGGRPQQQVVHSASAAVVSGGAVVHIPAAGSSKTAISCRVVLLDGSEVSVELPVSSWSGGLRGFSGGSGRVYWCVE